MGSKSFTLISQILRLCKDNRWLKSKKKCLQLVSIRTSHLYSGMNKIRTQASLFEKK
jgi:hypothetical protein